MTFERHFGVDPLTAQAQAGDKRHGKGNLYRTRIFYIWDKTRSLTRSQRYAKSCIRRSGI